MAETTSNLQQHHLRRLLAEASAAYQEAIQARDQARADRVAIIAQHQRIAADWAAANQYFTNQTAVLDQRAAELARWEKTLAATRAAVEAEVAGLREEAAALERRIHNTRWTLAELDSQRQALLGEQAGRLPEPSPPLAPSPAPAEASEVAAGDQADQQRLVAEQLAVLREAQLHWRQLEWQTVLEMEALAEQLCRREQELDARERRLIQAEARRRVEAHQLWRLRLQLEAEQSQLAVARLQAQPATEPTHELLALREEVERLAALLIDLAPSEADLPLAVEEIASAPQRSNSGSRAA
jgi:hypothetical protein